MWPLRVFYFFLFLLFFSFAVIDVLVVVDAQSTVNYNTAAISQHNGNNWNLQPGWTWIFKDASSAAITATGTITSVTLYFQSAPGSATTGELMAFSRSGGTNSFSFLRKDTFSIPNLSYSAGQRTFTVNLPVNSGEYLGIRINAANCQIYINVNTCTSQSWLSTSYSDNVSPVDFGSSNCGVVEISAVITLPIVGDPVFSGFHQQHFQIHGVSGEYFNLFSSKQFQMNSLFKFFSHGRTKNQLKKLNVRMADGRCTVNNNNNNNNNADGNPVYVSTQCSMRNESITALNTFSHSGTYLASVAVRIMVAPHTEIRLLIESGAWEEGFTKVVINDKPIAVGELYVMTSVANEEMIDSESKNIPRIFRRSSHEVELLVNNIPIINNINNNNNNDNNNPSTGSLLISFFNIDNFLNIVKSALINYDTALVQNTTRQSKRFIKNHRMNHQQNNDQNKTKTDDEMMATDDQTINDNDLSIDCANDSDSLPLHGLLGHTAFIGKHGCSPSLSDANNNNNNDDDDTTDDNYQIPGNVMDYLVNDGPFGTEFRFNRYSAE